MEKKIIEIFDISYEGAGVGKLDGQIVFVPKTLPKEQLEISVVKRNSNFLIGRLEKILKGSEIRIKPFCPYFDVCGGCDFQHCDYLQEIQFKKQILAKELGKAEFNGEIEIVLSEKRKNYRNKIKLEVKDGEIGYFRQKSHDFFKIEQCPVASEAINEILHVVKQFIDSNNFKALKNVYIKQVDNRLGVCFLFEKNGKKSLNNIKKIELFGENSVYFAYGDVLESNKTDVFCVFGSAKLHQILKGLDLEVDVSSFNQINDETAEKLYECIVDNTANKRVVNAYSGQGFLTFLISQKAKFVYGIEFQVSAHESAEKLKNLSDDFKFENICGKVEECLDVVLLRDSIDIIVLDPARDGCQKSVLNSILNSKIEQVIYVSCNFATLVRDLKILKENYKIERVLMFDMFPCTANMETVVLLSKKCN